MKPPVENSRRQARVVPFRPRSISAPVSAPRAPDRATLPPFDIALTRLPQVDGAAGLILSACLQFWSGFVGLQIRRISWICGQCAQPAHENIGGSVGETLPRLCKCGAVTRITLPKYAPDSTGISR